MEIGIRNVSEFVSASITIICGLWQLWAMLITLGLLSPSTQVTCRQPWATVTREHFSACKPPTTVFRQWDINAILPGADGQPLPIEYTLEHKKPHRLSIVDVDARDMQLGVYVDGTLRGLTTDFELDKSVNCGENTKECLGKNFSAGVVVVPPGKHSIKIVWEGKEYLAGTKSIDWGNDYSRRLKWQLEYCS